MPKTYRFSRPVMALVVLFWPLICLVAGLVTGLKMGGEAIVEMVRERRNLFTYIVLDPANALYAWYRSVPYAWYHLMLHDIRSSRYVSVVRNEYLWFRRELSYIGTPDFAAFWLRSAFVSFLKSLVGRR